jgi:monoterpene epsilon-lactone hydrolase
MQRRQLLSALGGVSVVMAAASSRAAGLLRQLAPSLQRIPRWPMPAVQTGHGLQLPARLIKPPTSITSTSQAALNAPLNPIWTCRPRTTDEWRALAAQVDLLFANRAARFTTASSSSGPKPPVEFFSLDGVPACLAVPNGQKAGHGLMVFSIHGGAYVLRGGSRNLELDAITIAERFNLPALSIDYRQLPDWPQPVPLQDVERAWLAAQKRYPQQRWLISGVSSGGALACSLIQKQQASGGAMPVGLAMVSPLVDLTLSGDSLQTHRGIDRDILQVEGLLQGAVTLYLQGADARHPELSPLFGSFRGFPPSLIISGSRDLLMSDAIRLNQALLQAEVLSQLQVFEAMSHLMISEPIPEQQQAVALLQRFAYSLRD